MGLKTLLVCLTTKEHADTLLNLAVPLARKHGAHLVGLHTVEALIVYPGIAMHIPEPAFGAFNESQREETAAIEAIFRERTQSEDFVSEWRVVRAEAASATMRMVESARAADLVIMAQEDRDADRSDQRHAPEQVIRHSGRPVIVVPLGYDGPLPGKRILLGWSDTREAARAAHDLVSVAAADAIVDVLRVGGSGQDELTDFEAIDLAGMYARHGLKAVVHHRERDGKEVAEVLTQVAFEQGADLMVTGAFGHSRTYDFVVGAATYDLLTTAKLPVMLSK